MAAVRDCVMVDIPRPSDRYEIHLESSSSWRAASSSIARWNWCRIGPDAILVERGTGYASLTLCFAAVASHKIGQTDALVEINLMHVPPRAAMVVEQRAEPRMAHRRRA